MNINSENFNLVSSALTGGGIPYDILPYSLAQIANETGGYNSSLLTTVNNASGIIYSGSKAQRDTGATATNRQQTDATGKFASYPSLDNWAQDFIRIISRSGKYGKPIEAISLPDYVHRLKGTGYFGAEAESSYLAKTLAGYNALNNGGFLSNLSTETPDDVNSIALLALASPTIDNSTAPLFDFSNYWVIAGGVIVVLSCIVIIYLIRKKKLTANG